MILRLLIYLSVYVYVYIHIHLKEEVNIPPQTGTGERGWTQQGKGLGTAISLYITFLLYFFFKLGHHT